ncbi:ALKBH8 [Cordylochernes scorpioides]|uniref:ALKBH8 n=1 Tax=Cordylochernes scorpioides TaxID=51811 RepID=A0ABY6LBD4_9ARAC|nr:ALKBH8 [Cordylochernes scorpioides]
MLQWPPILAKIQPHQRVQVTKRSSGTFVADPWPRSLLDVISHLKLGYVSSQGISDVTKVVSQGLKQNLGLHQKRRLQALQELARVLRPGGLALVYVWALEQDGPDGPSKYLKPQSIADPSQPASNTILPIHTNRTRFQSQDLFVPWKSKDGLTVHHRFYHVFTQGELESLVEQLPSDFKIVRNFYDSGNWCVVVEKLPST